MKKNILAVAALILGFQLSAAELKVQGDAVTFDKQTFAVTKAGSLVLSSPAGWISNFGISLATKHKTRWFTPGMPVCNPALKQVEKGVWEFSSRIPAGETDFVDLTMKTTVTPFNTIELDYAWKAQDMKNILELGMFLTVPMKEIGGKEIVLNGEPVKIVNETKYGWFSKVVENPEITMFKGEQGREYSISGAGKFNLVFQSGKDQTLVIRFYPIAKEMKLTVTPK